VKEFCLLEVIILTIKSLHENLKYLEIRENPLETHILCKASMRLSGRRPSSSIHLCTEEGMKK
jgi:hypothetical protein